MHAQELSTANTDVLFLKVDVDTVEAVAAEAGISAMPTFQVRVGTCLPCCGCDGTCHPSGVEERRQGRRAGGCQQGAPRRHARAKQVIWEVFV